MKITPMLEQYLDIKAQYPDCILFYRIGDFYEMFYQDAIDASEILDITLTKKHLGAEIEPAPLCGVPHHAAENYLSRLLAAGRKVAVCDQVEDPSVAKGLVRRAVTRVVTPGTATSELMLDAGRSNWLAAVWTAEGTAAEIAWADVSTGETGAATVSAADARALGQALLAELARLDPVEIVVCGAASEEDGGAGEALAALFARELRATVGVRPAEEFAVPSGATGGEAAAHAMAGLTAYVRYAMLDAAPDLAAGEVRVRQAFDHMVLDATAIRNLELTETMFDRETKGTLLWVLDRTRTAMGARLLKSWIRAPLTGTAAIDARLDAVEWLLDEVFARNHIREALRSVYDIERLLGRVVAGTANGRDLLALKGSLEAVSSVKAELAAPEGAVLRGIASELDAEDALCALLESALLEEQPVSVRDGNLFREGFSEDLDTLKAGASGGRQWIAELEERERARTGIRSLKVRYNRVQGYYIEVTYSNLSLVPEDYIRKQTLANAERFVTPELKKIETAVLSTGAQIGALEYELFMELLGRVQGRAEAIRATAAAVARMDALCSLAEAAQENGYVRPRVEDSERLWIVGGRHPVIERMLESTRGAGAFVKNDVSMNLADEQALLITGPNMAGKSTYMRQTALIVLMAQMGSFVPADEAVIGICDRIFTRVGASDNLAREQSTFLVEMNELSAILREYTRRSFLVLDEIGRGTSTYDGLAIAWAALDWLCAEGRRARVMFATHYHELTALEGVLSGLKNLSTQVDESGGSVVYLHKVAAGASSRSYGIHVAEMAGLPAALLADAREKLAALEAEAKDVRVAAPWAAERQVSLFAADGDGCGAASLQAGGRMPPLRDLRADPALASLAALLDEV
ncbi:MAG: DNA mismatch repair protein MutS, partial [Clostridiales Family XIII bacterium]|nr:DNA mismatch repair protein MutS [Clostridiales Family XIII bacterium]